MQLQVNDLYILQEQLDQRIFDLHSVKRETTLKERMLALLIELGEMANETRCFKYWSVKSKSADDVILEEYGDGIHFLLSLGIDLKDETNVIESNPNKQCNLTEQILLVYRDILALKEDFTLEKYHIAFSNFLTIGDLLGFSAEDIRVYYLMKNQKNHQRQDENY